MEFSSLYKFDGEHDYFLVKIEGENFLQRPPRPVPLRTNWTYEVSKFVPLPFYEAYWWEQIESKLRKIIAYENFIGRDLSKIIRSYKGKIDLSALDAILQDETLEFLKTSDYEYDDDMGMTNLIKEIAILALMAKGLLPQPIPLLRASVNCSLTMSQQQCACLLANAFFCTFPEYMRNINNYQPYNIINFDGIYSSSEPENIEKIRCILYYFYRVIMKMPCGTITFMRTSVNTNGSWGKNINLLTKLEARHEGVIEDDVDMMQVDFANRYIGGGVLSHGSVQEEIRFITCPEMIVACLVCEVMRENESIRIIGAETYSNYVGYGETFKWMRRPKQIETARDEFGRYKCELVAIDAIRYPNPYAQYRFARIKREITKAYSGFSIRTSPNERLTIATGNWGCGVFNGDRQLKSMIQYLAASRAKRNLVYFTFGDKNFANMLNQIVFSLRANHVTIGTLFTWILSYASCDISKSSLFEFIDERIYGNQV